MPAFQSEAMKAKAAEVWARLLGSFGESLSRKYPTPDGMPPSEWVTALGILNPSQIDRAFRRMNYQGLTVPPTLPMFMRLARGADDPNDPDAPPPPVRRSTEPEMDSWEAEANRRLLVHLRNRLAKNPDCYGQGARQHTDYRHPSAVFDRNVRRLVEAKRAYAADMRDLAQNDAKGRVPMSLSTAVWDDYIGFAERQMEAEAPNPPEATQAPW